MVIILMMPAKLGTPGLLKIKKFRDKERDSHYILYMWSHDQNLVTLAFF